MIKKNAPIMKNQVDVRIITEPIRSACPVNTIARGVIIPINAPIPMPNPNIDRLKIKSRIAVLCGFSLSKNSKAIFFT
jgi:hypothetical protein